MNTQNNFKIAIIGNPNSGKTTLFNGLTGSKQRVGNWPGVTVEKVTGFLELEGKKVEIVDLPGVYSLSAESIDEKIARDFILSRDYDAIINIVDASNLERNLFLTLNLIEMNIPIILLLNKIDVVQKNSVEINLDLLSKELNLPVFPINSTKKEEVEKLKKELPSLIREASRTTLKIEYPEEMENIIKEWSPKINDIAQEMNISSRWVCIKLLERDPIITKKVTRVGALTDNEINSELDHLKSVLKEDPEVLIATSKFGYIKGLTKEVVKKRKQKISFSDRIDAFVMNRFLGIPIFLVVLYFTFWIVINFGGAFIDFFDIFFGTIFVDGIGNALSMINSPDWLTTLLAKGIGGGIQTVATFVPIMFMMFFMLALLEDSGYMARAAFVMDRFMRFIGLPGKAFVPLMVGFGCTVPAVMATRTLENEKDRYLTVFMAPLMSCGARLPVYALFGIIFFPKNPTLITFSLYLVGISLAILTGVLLKNTVFKGETSHFVMELPSYNPPRFKHIMILTWTRLRAFLKRAGIIIIIVVTILGFLNSIGTDGTLGNEDTENSVLSVIGKSITPIFVPMGIEEDNWPASVAIFTGLFAKEVVVGTLNGLYMQDIENSNVEEGTESEGFDFWGQIIESFVTIPENLKGIGSTLSDPLGFGIVEEDQESLTGELEVAPTTFSVIRERFNNQPARAYAYLLFILIYFPCVAAFGAILKEIGPFYGGLSVTYLTVLAWIVATLFYQLTIGHSVLWISVAIALLLLIVLVFYLLGKRRERDNEN